MPIDTLLEIMARLRDTHNGCPWDREQTFATIAPYTLEEAYEVADAITREDYPALREELGDLLFQVVFHAQMAREAGMFDFADIVRSICTKMQRRHPHVFGAERITSAEQQTHAWEAHKARERSAKQAGATPGLLEDIPLALPALTRAHKLGKRAATVGFEWPDWRGARAKIDEELGELDRALAGTADAHALEHEVGDLLFAVVNLARYLKVDPEAALRACNARFQSRFGYVERRAREQGQSLTELDLAAMDRLWEEAKSTP